MIAEKQSLRAALAAAICAFGVSFGAVFCPVSAFGLPVDSWALLLVCLAASIVFSVIFAVFRPVYGFGATAVAAGAFAWFFHGEALLSAMGLFGGILEEYVQAFHFSMPQALADAAESGADATMALGIFAALLALCTVWTVLSRMSLLGVFLASLPFLVVCLVILQTEPATLPMLTLTGSLTLLVLTQKLRFDTTQSGHRLTLHLMVPVAILMAALALLFPRYGYERSAWSKSLSPMVSRTAEKLTVFRRNAATGQVEFVSPFTPSTLGRWVWDSNVSSVNLKRVGPQRKTGRRVMQVYSDFSAACHLRADSMAVYEDSRWMALSEEDYDGSGVSAGVLLAPDVQTLGLDTVNKLQIKTDMKSSIYYLPYRPLELPTGGEAVFDAYVKNPSQLTEYTIETAFVEETADRNAQYERFVHRTYTQLPDDIRPDLQAIVSGIDGADASDTKTAARDCKICFQIQDLQPRHAPRAGGRGFCALVSARERYRLLCPFHDGNGTSSSRGGHSGALRDGLLFQDDGRSMGGCDRGRRACVGGVLYRRHGLADHGRDACGGSEHTDAGAAAAGAAAEPVDR